MSLYENYKRYKAGKTVHFLSKRTEKLFKIEFSDKQIMELSEWDNKNDIYGAIGMFFIFILGAMYGSGY